MISILVTAHLLLLTFTIGTNGAPKQTVDASEPVVTTGCIHTGSGSYYICDYNPACFPGEATVKLQDGTTKTMDVLRIGDIVQAWDPASGGLLWSKVELFLDHNTRMTSEFVEIETEMGDKIALTARHLIPIRVGDGLQWKWAKEVVVGDEVHNVERWVHISKVASRVSQGVYAPLTSAGTLMVDGVAASCFAIVHAHDWANLAIKPAVWMAQWFGESVQQGIHWYSRLLLDYAAPVAPSFVTR